MTISSLALAAKKVIDAAWQNGTAYDLSSQAAFALESAQLLQSPETAAELYDLRTQLAAMANPPRELFLALYDGAEPELFTTVEAARECCDDLATTDAHGKCWDWTVNEHGIHVQFWTHPDDDRPMGDTSGNVTPVVVQGAEPLSELERLRARVAELEAEVRLLNTQRGDVAQLVERERGEGEECVDIDVVVAALYLDSDETAEQEAVRRSVDAQFPKVAEFLRESGGAE